MVHALGPKSMVELQAKAIELIGLCYEAAFDSVRWGDFLKAYSELYPDAAQWLWLEDRERANVHVLTSENCDASFLRSYEDYYCTQNPWSSTMLIVPEGSVFRSEELAPDEILLAGEFYNEWLKPQKLENGFGASVLNAERHRVLFSTVHSGRKEVSPADLELLRIVVPHMQRAVRLHGRLLGVEQRANQTEELADRLDVGLVLLDAGGLVLSMNRESDRIIASRDGLSVLGRRLSASSYSDQARLSKIISEMIAVSKRERVTTDGALAISRPSGKRSYGVIVSPLLEVAARSPLSLIAPVARACVFISDPEKIGRPSEKLLMDIFGLTPSEARMAALLASGASLSETCEAMRITRETGRDKLKAIYEKTDTHRQGELVRLLLTGGGGLAILAPRSRSSREADFGRCSTELGSHALPAVTTTGSKSSPSQFSTTGLQ